MTSLCVWIFNSIFGMMVEVKKISEKNKLERNKYMGMWRWELVITAKIMREFPMKMTRYMDRNRQKTSGCSSASSESSRE